MSDMTFEKSETNTQDVHEEKPEVNTTESTESTEEKHGDWFNGIAPEAQKEITKLRAESAKHRTAKQDVQSKYNEAIKKGEEYDELLTKQAEEKGEFKELYESTKIKLDELTGIKENADKYKAILNDEIEKEMESLSDVQKELLDECNVSIEKKLELVKKMKGEKVMKTNSPALEDSGNYDIPNTIDISKYRNPEGRKELMKLKRTDPPLYDEILRIKNKT